MPHELFHNPDISMERSLGWMAADWIEELCIRGNGPLIGQKVEHLIDDYVRFLVTTYALDNDDNLAHVSSFISRPKGFGKSEIAAYIGLFDSLGPSRFSHYAGPEGEKYICPYGTGYTYHYAPGEPVGKPMATPIVLCVATEEGQSAEIFSTCYINCKEGPLSAAFPNKNDVGLTRINVPGGGYIKPITASGDSKDGSKPSLVLADEAMAMDTIIPTPSGWTTMGDVQVGDMVVGPSGQPTRVVKTTPVQLGRDCFKVRFGNGESITVSAGHLWEVTSPTPGVYTTSELFVQGQTFGLPLATPVDHLINVDDDPFIVEISRTESVPVKCIGVDNPRSLFMVTRSGYLTHNTHLWKTPELHNLYKTLSRSLLKRRKEGTFFVESSTMHGVGEGSVAEQAYDAIDTIRAGKFKGRIRQNFDHRYGSIAPEDLGDVEKVKEALTESYGEALAWNDLDGMVDQVMDLRDGADISATYRYWFNDKHGVSDSFLLNSQWQSCGPSGFNDDETDTKNYFPTPPPISPGDTIVMGFDGSRKRQRGITDSTALVGCRVKDGVLFLIDVWEQPVDYHGTEGWEVDASVVDIAVRKAFKDYRVVGFYADPSMYTPWVAQWESRYGPSLKVKATQQHPIEYWFGGSNVGKKIVKAIDDFEDAVINRELKHFNNLTMTQHILNCRRKETSAGRQLGKETPSSPKKIDVAIAAIIAWQARLDAVSKGLATTKKRTAYRLR